MKQRKEYSARFKIAGTVVEVVTPYRYTRTNLADFYTTQQADCQVIFNSSEVIINQVLDDDESLLSGWEGFFPVELVTKKIAEILIDFDTFLIHGAGISYSDSGYLFSAPSGTGKTTHILKWLNNLPEARVINGDKPFVKAERQMSPMLCGSPWGGKENMSSNLISPLNAIVFMERSENNSIERITFNKAFPYLLQQIYRPAEQERMKKTLALIQRLSTDVAFWHFQFNNFKDDCFDVAYNALVRGGK